MSQGTGGVNPGSVETTLVVPPFAAWDAPFAQWADLGASSEKTGSEPTTPYHATRARLGSIGIGQISVGSLRQGHVVVGLTRPSAPQGALGQT